MGDRLPSAKGGSAPDCKGFHFTNLSIKQSLMYKLNKILNEFDDPLLCFTNNTGRHRVFLCNLQEVKLFSNGIIKIKLHKKYQKLYRTQKHLSRCMWTPLFTRSKIGIRVRISVLYMCNELFSKKFRGSKCFQVSSQ